MNQETAKMILRDQEYDEPQLDWSELHRRLDTTPGSDATMRAWAMDRVRWIANGGALESYPKEYYANKAAKLAQEEPEGQTAPAHVQPPASATEASVGPGNGIGDRCIGCGNPVIDYDQWDAGEVGCNKDGDCPITSESVRREVAAAVIPLVRALETLCDTAAPGHVGFGERFAARKLCREAREKWGTK